MENQGQLYFGLFKITNAAITPGIHPASVNKKTITIEPQPLSKIDNGGKTIANKTRHKLIFDKFFKNKITIKTFEKQFLNNYNSKINPIFAC